MEDVKSYLDSKGWKYRQVNSQKGVQFLIDHCPFCKSTNWSHFYISEDTGQYYCHKCGERGSLLSLKEAQGDLAKVASFKDAYINKEVKPTIPLTEVNKAHMALLSNGIALKYLKRRRFSSEAIEHFKLGYSEELNNQWLWFPYIVGGEVKDIKKRSLVGKSFIRVGGESVLLNEDILHGSLEEVIITEGESDCIALWSAGYKNVVGATIGAKGINPNWIDLLDKLPRIYIAYDMDDDGIEGAYKFANRLGIEKCYKIVLPPGVKDVNEFFQRGYTLEQFNVLITQARPFHVQYVSTLGEEVVKLIYRLGSPEKDEESLHLPWPQVDKLVNGFCAGDLVSLAGMPGVGKTSFALNLAYLYSRNRIPTLFFLMENRPQRIIPRLVSTHSNTNTDEVMRIDFLQEVYRELKEYPFFFAYMYKKPNFDFCADTIRKAFRRYGIRFVVFDNLHFLARSLSDQTREVSVIVQSFKLLAEELGIPILLISRPRKLQFNRKIITNQDLKDSADIEGDSDTVILIHRDPLFDSQVEHLQATGVFKPRTIVIVSKARWGSGGTCIMYMDDKKCRITEEEVL